MRRFVSIMTGAGLLFGCTQAPEVPKEASPDVLASGLKVYTSNCASCHQVDGSGVSNMQPALTNDGVVEGAPDQLIQVVVKGPAAVLPANRPHFSNTMPAFGRLTDQQIADVLSYLRHDFGQQASPIEVQQVQTARSQLTP